MPASIKPAWLGSFDVAATAESFRTAEPFPAVCIDGFLEPSFAADVARAYPSWDDAERWGLQFNATNERRKVQITDPSRFPSPVKLLADRLATEEFRKLLSDITGIPNLLWDDSYTGGGMHQTAAKGRLDVHVDFNRLDTNGLYRRVNLLLYLNDGWKDDWGGRIELWDKDVQTCRHSFAPVLNRCLIFATSEISFHGVTPLSCPPDVIRRSFALYYYTKEAPRGAVETHSTIFKARPEEFMRRMVLMPAEHLKYRIRETAGRLGRQAKRALLRRG